MFVQSLEYDLCSKLCPQWSQHLIEVTLFGASRLYIQIGQLNGAAST
ncbi:hypothetical protein ACHAWT_000992, partial [Skeletonema menzelii]